MLVMFDIEEGRMGSGESLSLSEARRDNFGSSLGRVLICDDNEDVRCFVRDLLAARGIRVDQAGDGQQALAMLLASRYDLLLLDQIMPSMSGLELLDRIHPLQVDLPVVMMTGNANSSFARQAMKKGATACLRKPFDLRLLVELVEKHLANQLAPPLQDQPIHGDVCHREINMKTEQSGLLIVDDSRLTCRKIRQILEQDGHSDIVECGSGEEALAALRQRSFDLFLLDINMPGIDGLELCRRIKDDPRFRDAPVLFVTGSLTLESRLECFQAGGVDYIPKPFHSHELINRVRVHLDLLHRNRENLSYAEAMEALAEQRAQQLLHAERLGTLGTLTAGIIHEIRNGVGIVSQNAQLMQMAWPQLREMMAFALEHGYAGSPQSELLMETFDEGLRDTREGIGRIKGLSEDILHFIHKESNAKPTPTSLYETIEQSLAIVHHRLKYHVTIRKDMQSDTPPVLARNGSLSQVFVNLFLNAADATEGMANAELRIALGTEGDFAVCTIADNGCGIAKDALHKLWDPFFTTKANGTGLGLSLSRKIVQDIGGSMEVASSPGKGTCFTIRLRTDSLQK